jgi:hypothetical protein
MLYHRTHLRNHKLSPLFFQEVELAAYFGLCAPAANREVKKYEDRSRSLIELLQLYSGASTFRSVGCEVIRDSCHIRG